jgi:Tfp pilus assembly protein PilO
MMERVASAAGELHPRALLAVIAFIITFIVFEGWMLVLRKPFADYQKVAATRATLSEKLQQLPDQAGELGRLSTELKQLSEQLGGELRLPASDDKMAASLMAALDQSAAAHSVMLSGVKPRERKPVSVFEEVSFDISARGSYLRLCEWMLDFGNTVGNNATISEFDMKTAEEGRQVMLVLKIALYRPLKIGESSK